MFSKMIDQLKDGELPSSDKLSALLKVALVKKQGVLQQPRACWTSDPKINPDSGHLLWAAIILGREEEIHAAAGIMVSEIISRTGKTESVQDYGFLNDKISELEELAPTLKFAELLREKAELARKIISDNSH